MATKRLVIDGFGQVELNNVAFRRDGRIVAQCAPDTTDFASFLANSTIFSFNESVNCHLFFSEVFLALLLELPDTLTVLIAFDIFISITSLENLFSI